MRRGLANYLGRALGPCRALHVGDLSLGRCNIYCVLLGRTIECIGFVRAHIRIRAWGPFRALYVGELSLERCNIYCVLWGRTRECIGFVSAHI